MVVMLSIPDEYTILLSNEMPQEVISLLTPKKLCLHSPLARFQSLMDPSQDDERRISFEELRTKSETK